jgi:hypothetical protein
MTDLAITTGGPNLHGSHLLRTVASVVACHRWAYAMQMRYDQLGAKGFEPGAAGLEALMASLDPDPRGL